MAIAGLINISYENKYPLYKIRKTYMFCFG